MPGNDQRRNKRTTSKKGATIGSGGKKTIEDWLQRFEGLSPETTKTCNFKF